MKLNNLEAIQAQGSLSRLMEIDLPIKVSLDIAIISNIVDVQVKAYGVVLGNLYKKYSIRPEASEGEGTTRFTCSVAGENEEASIKLRGENLEAFAEKFNDLLEAKTEDLTFKKIQLPSDITIKPEILKALTEFVEIG